MAISEDTKLIELERIQGELRELLPLLPKWKVEALQGQISQHYVTKWKHKSFRKYGTLNKGFTDDELATFLSSVDDERFRLLFEFQAYIGLRIGEAVKVNLEDFNFKTREMKIRTEKARTLDQLRIPEFFFTEVMRYIRQHEEQIRKADGFLFFVCKEKSRSGLKYLNANYVRKEFRKYAISAGLDETYGSTDETIPNRAKRALHRLTTHSLRHRAITSFNRSVNGNITLTKAFARHRELSSTQVYVHVDKEELYAALEKAQPANVSKVLA